MAPIVARIQGFDQHSASFAVSEETCNYSFSPFSTIFSAPNRTGLPKGISFHRHQCAVCPFANIEHTMNSERSVSNPIYMMKQNVLVCIYVCVIFVTKKRNYNKNGKEHFFEAPVTSGLLFLCLLPRSGLAIYVLWTRILDVKKNTWLALRLYYL